MKSFKYYISERTNPHGAFDNNPSNGYLGPDVLKRVNAIIGSKVREDLSDGASGVAVVRNILSKIGLTFGATPTMAEEKGSFELPLTLFGGRFGKDTDTPHNEFLEDDGVSHKVEGGLSLNISYEMTETNQCRLRARIE